MTYSYRYYRFVPTTLRGGAAVSVRMSEFAMLTGTTRLTGMSISATNNSSAPGEDPGQAGDNNTATQWVNANGIPTTLVYDFGTATVATGYRWATNTDFSANDSVSWHVDGSADGSTWTVLDTQASYDVTTSRSTFLDDFTFASTDVLLGTSTRYAASVEVAWGADIAADEDTWTWTDITSDVLVDGGEQVTYALGRQDEAATSQPASARLRLDNRTGAYSLGPQGSNWPNVRRNTPLRIWVGGGIAPVVVYQGYIDSWSPDWDVSGNYAVVDVVASGILRRLGQGRQPVLSSIRRAMRDLIGVNLLEYWPMEDGRNATSFGSDIPGHQPLTVNSLGGALPKYADSAPFACSDRLPNLNFAWLDGIVSPYAHTGELQVRALIDFPANGMNDGISLINLLMNLSTSAVEDWDLKYGTGGTLTLVGYDSGGGVLFTSPVVSFDVDGQRLRVGFYLQQNGANIDYKISTYAPDAPTASTYTASFSTVTLGKVVEVNVNDGSTAGEPVFGHLTLQNDATSIFTDAQDLSAWTGEGAIDRVGRLCSENGIPSTVYSDGRPGPAMGPQSVAGVLELLRECEAADQGVLYDGHRGGGLIYLAHNQIVNQSAGWELDASAGRVRAISPVDDDQQLRNRVTASRSGGGSIIAEDVDGPLGTEIVGVYDDSVTINCYDDDQLPDYAGWLINLGTVEGYRYPTLDADLRDLTSTLARAMLNMLSTSRYDIANLSAERTQLPAETVRLLTYGWSGSFDKHEWKITHNTGRYEPWKIVELDESDDVHGLRPDTDGSTLAGSASAGATSLSVATPSGPLWTTAAGDMPMTVWVGDLPVTVSAISGGSSPQTFTCTAITLARASGVAVSLPRPVPVLDIDDESGD